MNPDINNETVAPPTDDDMLAALLALQMATLKWQAGFLWRQPLIRRDEALRRYDLTGPGCALLYRGEVPVRVAHSASTSGRCGLGDVLRNHFDPAEPNPPVRVLTFEGAYEAAALYAYLLEFYAFPGSGKGMGNADPGAERMKEQLKYELRRSGLVDVTIPFSLKLKI